MKFRLAVLLCLLPSFAFAQTSGDPLKDDALRGFILSYARARPAAHAREALAGLRLTDAGLHRALVRLAAEYEEIGRFRDATSLYRDLVNEAPRSTEATLFEAKLLELTAIEGRREATARQALELKAAFEAATPTPDAKDEAERILSALIVAWHRERPDFDVERANRATDTLYQTYLSLFPTGEKAYQLRFFRAEFAYGQLGDYRLAAELYDQVLKEDIARLQADPTATPGRFMELAAFDAILAWDQLAKDEG